MADRSNTAQCRCDETAITLTGAPILSSTCYCRSCRTAGLGFERELGAPHTVHADGGVDYCSYRKDRVKIARGAKHLKEYRLKPESPTRRVVAMCCGSPMFTDFTPSHWLSIFRDRLAGQAPPPQMRIMTRDRPQGVTLSGGVPAYETMPPFFMLKLIASWAAMGFRRPKITW